MPLMQTYLFSAVRPGWVGLLIGVNHGVFRIHQRLKNKSHFLLTIIIRSVYIWLTEGQVLVSGQVQILLVITKPISVVMTMIALSMRQDKLPINFG